MNPGAMGLRSTKSQIALLVFGGFLLYVAGSALQHFAAGSAVAAIGIRLIALAIMAFAALRHRTLTAWIFFAMIAGIEFGLDAPHAAISCRIFSDIFLRLIKLIVAPLIWER